MYEFDAALQATATGEGTWATTIADGWDFAGIPNGGMIMSLVAARLGSLTGHPDPVTVTAHYTAPAMPGPAEIQGELLRSGRRLGTASGRLIQNGKVVAHVLGTFGDLAKDAGEIRYEAGLPALPSVADCVGREDLSEFPFPAIFNRVDMRFHPNHLGFARGAAGERPEIAGWLRFLDGRPPDPLAMLLFSDGHPPAVFNAPSIPVAWVPTIELTVHVHKRPAGGWIGSWFTVDHIIGGFLQEDGVLWDEDGDVVAVSRQLAALPR